ncbi:MAG: aminoacetone oxidase family FAD-binding enzyme [Christensenellales bacterium]
MIIIGGGASGLAAACTALQAGLRVTVLEARDRIGRKLLATGNGRCNLLNVGPPVYFGDPAFARAVLDRCPARDVLAFFHHLGLLTQEEEKGLVYPASGQASTVLEVLRLPLEGDPRCLLVCDAPVTGLKKTGPGGFLVETASGGRFSAPRVLAAAGSPAQPQLSGAEGLYPLLGELGHRIIPPRPALTGLVSDPEAVRGLKGLRVPAIATLVAGGRPIGATEGEVIFASDGISGVCIMQLSRDAGQALRERRQPVVYLDFSPLLGLSPRLMGRRQPADPDLNGPRMLSYLQQREAEIPGPAFLLGALPRLLAQRLLGLNLRELAEALSAFPVPLRALRGFEHAQVAAGGVDTRQVAPETLESRLLPGLHLSGELLNVDGDCGGYNLLFAWASGILAARAAAEGLRV